MSEWKKCPKCKKVYLKLAPSGLCLPCTPDSLGGLAAEVVPGEPIQSRRDRLAEIAWKAILGYRCNVDGSIAKDAYALADDMIVQSSPQLGDRDAQGQADTTRSVCVKCGAVFGEVVYCTKRGGLLCTACGKPDEPGAVYCADPGGSGGGWYNERGVAVKTPPDTVKPDPVDHTQEQRDCWASAETPSDKEVEATGSCRCVKCGEVLRGGAPVSCERPGSGFYTCGKCGETPPDNNRVDMVTTEVGPLPSVGVCGDGPGFDPAGGGREVTSWKQQSR